MQIAAMNFPSVPKQLCPLCIFAALVLSTFLLAIGRCEENPPPSFSGIYPHLSYSNREAECGTGAVVPWADRLWVITYGPHLPRGSSDKLYEIDEELRLQIRPESVGGTPAGRMIHGESQQLFIGPYAIDADRKVRVIPPSVMPGRLTGIARHLKEPAEKLYYATMEEGFYEVDVNSLAVKELYPDANGQRGGHGGKLLPGYHGKGLYSGQGRLVYANNGELSPEALRRPEIPSGSLAEWDGEDWNIIRRNQFTEVTGPGGLRGNAQPETDPLWSIGWDHRSLILMLLSEGRWHSFRLPKASHTYDGAHGWNTEWPRIRDIGEQDLLMTMHGMFWRFPKTFSADNTAGIAPRSSYLKVIGDFCRWNDRLVFGCDDSAKSEFLNKRKAKGEIAAPGVSHSNLWFLDAQEIDRLGPVNARGAVWLRDAVKAEQPSEPFLFSGSARRSAHLSHNSAEPVTFSFEIDATGRGNWQPLKDVEVPVNAYRWMPFSNDESGHWVRVRTNRDCAEATVMFTYTADRSMPEESASVFAGLASPHDQSYSGGLVRARGDERLSLHFAASEVRDGRIASTGYYEMGPEMKLTLADAPKDHQWLQKNVKVPTNVLQIDEASVLFIDDAGKRYRLPKGNSGFNDETVLPLRVAREVCTERDLFNAHGTFYELPAENAGGFAKIRPIATHNRLITDYCSWRGLLVLTGVSADRSSDNPHIIRSGDGICAVWVGAVDDLWKFGKPVGEGGPWKETAVRADEPSDPYLMTGYDRKALELYHKSNAAVSMRVEIDVSGSGDWMPYRTFDVPAGERVAHRFDDAFQACWVRLVSNHDCNATARLVYE